MSRAYRVSGVLLAVTAIMLCVAGTAQAQRRNQGRQGGPFGGGPQITAATLLGAEAVQKELKLKEDQVAKIKEIGDALRTESRELYQGLQDLSAEERRAKMAELRKKTEELNAAAQKKFDEILDKDQQKRLKEVLVQVQGAAALLTDDIGSQLKITEEQKKQLTEVQTKLRSEQQELFQGLRDLSAEERREKQAELTKKRQELTKAADEKMLALLTADQKASFEKMKGEKFEFDRAQLFPQRPRRNQN